MNVLLRLLNSYLLKDKPEIIKTIDNHMEPTDLMEIIGHEINKKDRLELFYIENKYLLEGREAFEIMFNLLKTTTNIFDKPRIVFVIGVMDVAMLDNTAGDDPIEHAYTYNTLVTKDTTFEEYWAEIEDYVLRGKKSISAESTNTVETLLIGLKF